MGQMRRYLVVLLVAIRCNCEEDPDHDERCYVDPWLEYPKTMPINYYERWSGTQFIIANSYTTRSTLWDFTEQSSNSGVAVLENKAENIHELRNYLSYDIRQVCSIETTNEEACLKIASDELPDAFLGIYNVSHPSDPGQLEIEEISTGDFCQYGTFNIHDIYDLPRSVWTLCDLDNVTDMILSPYSKYYIMLKWDEPYDDRYAMLFSLPFTASAQVTITCGKDPESILNDLIAEHNPDSTTTEYSGEWKRNDDKQSFTPELIAAITIGCSVCIAAVVITILIIHAKRNKPVKKLPESPSIEPSINPYDPMHVPLVRDNSYQDSPTARNNETWGYETGDHYDTVNPDTDPNPYAEIPADINQSQYTRLSRDQSGNNAVVSDDQSEYATIPDDPDYASNVRNTQKQASNNGISSVYIIPIGQKSNLEGKQTVEPNTKGTNDYEDPITPRYLEILSDGDAKYGTVRLGRIPHYIGRIPPYLEMVDDNDDSNPARQIPHYIEIVGGNEEGKGNIPYYIKLVDEKEYEKHKNIAKIPHHTQLIEGEDGTQNKEQEQGEQALNDNKGPGVEIIKL